MNLSNLFDLTLVERRDEIGLEFQGRIFTFGEIDRRGNRMARLLAGRGLEAGDRLCVYLANSLEMIDLYLACAKLGVIFVPINILYREREVAHILGDAEPKAIVSGGDFPGGATTVWNAAEAAREASALSDERPQADLDGDAPAAIIYTSGTTGASKGAILTHNNFGANAINVITCWKISGADKLLLPLPLFHVHGLGNGLCSWLIAGYRMRLLERFEHQAAPQQFLDFGPTVFFGVPTMYVRLLEVAPAVARQIGASMRLFVSGSAPLPAQVLEEFRELYGHAILERYGMTETLMNIGNPYSGERRAGTVGLPFPGVSVKIAGGELYVRGPNVFPGYWKREEATRAAFVDGYFRTGDLAERSTDGYYTLKGRKSDLIISGGFNIYPREIEEFLLEQPGVAEAAVVGLPDRVRGEVPVAYIVPKGVFDPDALEQACRAKLASFKVPRSFRAVDNLPRTALGKIQKHLLPLSGE
ncbi:MAG: AMP-binding protein [Candidatus Solibacter usitatus]|nr:AMP-binding protein [Candidatus Solibacter usitatus]